MLLAIDVGNTETVIGLFRLEGDETPAATEGAGYSLAAEDEPTRGLTHHWRLSTVPSRTKTSTRCC